MIEEAARDRVTNDSGENLLGVERASRFQNTIYLLQRSPPVWNMVQNAEVEDRVVGGVGHGDCGCIADPKPRAIRLDRKPAARPVDHSRVEIESVHPSGVELLKDNLHAYTASASDFQYGSASDVTAHSTQLGGLEPTLERLAQRVVHQGEFKKVEYHDTPYAS